MHQEWNVFDHRTHKHFGRSKTILPKRIRQAGVLDCYFGWGLRFWARDEFWARRKMQLKIATKIAMKISLAHEIKTR